MKNRRRQREKRRIAAQKKKQEEEAKVPSLSNRIDGLLGTVVGLLLLYWFYSGMIASCASWVP